jgi:hypothetical protein
LNRQDAKHAKEEYCALLGYTAGHMALPSRLGMPSVVLLLREQAECMEKKFKREVKSRLSYSFARHSLHSECLAKLKIFPWRPWRLSGSLFSEPWSM